MKNCEHNFIECEDWVCNITYLKCKICGLIKQPFKNVNLKPDWEKVIIYRDYK